MQNLSTKDLIIEVALMIKDDLTNSPLFRQYLDEIRSRLYPLDTLIHKIKAPKDILSQGFDFNSEHWKGKIEDSILSKFKSYDDKKITRKDIIDSYKDYFSNIQTKEVLIPFLLTMFWGYGDNGYGPYRVNQILRSDKNIDTKGILAKSMSYINEKKVEEAFKELKQIKGLGISFASKVLYFASKGKGQEISPCPLIFDIKVATTLVKLHSSNKEVINMIEVYPKNSWTTYNQYNILLHDWANEYKVEADQIERLLFDIDT